MYVSLLKEIVSSILGPQGVFIAEMLYGKKNVNEFAIAKKLKLTINQTRNMLYRLSDEGLVSFIRKKDTKKGGWYTYFWTLSLEKSLAKFREKLQKDIQHQEKAIQDKKTIRYFKCNACGNEMTEDQALLSDYHCSECGELMHPKDTTAEIQETNLKVDKLRQILSKVESELGTVQAEEGKKKVRKFKAELKKKQVERAAKRKQRQKEMKKLNKKSNKFKKSKSNKSKKRKGRK